jgi:hypothetical protein
MRSKWPIYSALATVVGLTGLNFAYLSSENEQNRQLSVSNQAVRASMIQLQNELQAVKGQLDELRITLRSPASAPSAALPQPSKARARRTLRAQAVATLWSDSHFNQLQKQLSDQQKQLANTRDDLDKTREHLEGTLSSTKDELSGSIARNHDELVALQKRGERTYYEFHLTESKTFERVGPLQLSLRKADIKHKRFDIMIRQRASEEGREFVRDAIAQSCRPATAAGGCGKQDFQRGRCGLRERTEIQKIGVER